MEKRNSIGLRLSLENVEKLKKLIQRYETARDWEDQEAGNELISFLKHQLEWQGEPIR